MNTIVCLKVGTKYSADYVNRLYSMIHRHLSGWAEFICITDDTENLSDGIKTVPPLRHDYLRGWWHKVALFGGYKFEAERIVFLDLDTVITRNIDFLFQYQGDFAILRDFYYPSNQYGSAIMSIRKGFGQDIWDRFAINPLRALQTGPGDQDWIRTNVEHADKWQDLFPDKIVSYKVHCGHGLPQEASIVCFHGQPRPHEVDDDWIKEHWR